MNGLSTEYINSCARQLGAKRLRFELPWEQSPLDDILSSGKKPTIQKPDWVEFPVQLWGPVSTANKPTKLDRYNARTHLSDVSWVAAENKKHNLALQCWKVIVLDSTSHTALGQLLMRCIELGKSEDYILQVVADAFSQKATSTLKSRAASLLSFGRWKRASAAGQPQGIFPLTEEQAYDYLCELRRLHAAPRAAGFWNQLVLQKGFWEQKSIASWSPLESEESRGAQTWCQWKRRLLSLVSSWLH